MIELVFEGADRGREKDSLEEISFSRSLPLEKARHSDMLLVLRMNGKLLEPSHGFPIRLIAPGWYGVACVKWLQRIEAVATSFRGCYQTTKYTVRRQTGHGLETEMLGPMEVKTEIVRPADGSELGIGTNRIFGMAWAGEEAVSAVEVSVDGGKSWKPAELNGPKAPYSWTL